MLRQHGRHVVDAFGDRHWVTWYVDYGPARAIARRFKSVGAGPGAAARCRVPSDGLPRVRGESVQGIPYPDGTVGKVRWQLPTRPCPSCSNDAHYVIDARTGLVSHLTCAACDGAWLVGPDPLEVELAAQKMTLRRVMAAAATDMAG